MAKKHKSKKTGEVYWVCDCGSGLRASYNVKNKLNCPDEERACVHCFNQSRKGQ